MPDCTQLTYQQMADIVRSIRNEVKERNPIFVNAYIQPLGEAINALEEISEGEVDNPPRHKLGLPPASRGMADIVRAIRNEVKERNKAAAGMGQAGVSRRFNLS